MNGAQVLCVGGPHDKLLVLVTTPPPPNYFFPALPDRRSVWSPAQDVPVTDCIRTIRYVLRERRLSIVKLIWAGRGDLWRWHRRDEWATELCYVCDESTIVGG